MSNDTKENTKKNIKEYDIETSDLPLHCPTPKMKLWNTHPRVFLEIEKTGETKCPYCGTQFILKPTPCQK
jgi:uncharacterized Zn-finger protein